MGDVLRQIGSSADYYPSGMVDDGFCGLDPRAWIRFSRGSHKEPEFEDRNNGTNQRSRVNLLYYEELRTLSQTNLKLTFHPNDTSPKQTSGSEISADGCKKTKRTYWSRPLPQLASFRCVAGSVPKIRVRASVAESVLGSKRSNPVFRSNSFRYEKYSTDDPNLDTVSEKSVNNTKKVVSVSEEYHTPKDLISRLPLLQTDRTFDQGTPERPHSSADVRSFQSSLFDSRTNLFDHSDDFIVEVPYTDPKDSKLYTQPGVDPHDDQIYKVYVGSDTLYCRPYQQLRQGSKLITHPAYSSSQPVLLKLTKPQKKMQKPSQELLPTYEDVRLRDDCVTIIPVCVTDRNLLVTSSAGSGNVVSTPPSSPSPTNDSGATPTTLGSETSSDRGSFLISSPYYLQSEAGDISGPYYENLDFHRVSIRVPTTTNVTRTVVKNDPSASNIVLRRYKNRQLDKKSGLFVKTPGLSDGICSSVVVDSDNASKSSLICSTDEGRRFVKFGYSQHEVWNWLHREDSNANNNVVEKDLPNGETKKLYLHHATSSQNCSTCQINKSSGSMICPHNNNNSVSGRKTFEVKFSAFEFLAASARLSSVNIEGLETFVASMLGNAIAGRQNIPESVRQDCLFPKQKKRADEKSSTFCTIRSQLQHKVETLNIGLSCSNNNHNCSAEVLISGHTSAPAISCSRCCNESNSPATQESVSSHNYQSLYHIVPNSCKSRASTRAATRSYASLEALNKDCQGYSESLYRPTACQPLARIDTNLPLDRQEWYHGSISRIGAENLLRLHEEGSFLVRNSESSSQDFSLSVKSSRGFMHMRIQENQTTDGTTYILGQFSKPFRTVSLMVQFYTENRLPIKGAEHTYLKYPVVEELL